MGGDYDIVCFSPVGWDVEWQRPHQLLRRFARERRVFYIQEPVSGSPTARLEGEESGDSSVRVFTPRLPEHISDLEKRYFLVSLINQLVNTFQIQNFILWHFTPRFLEYTRQLCPQLVIYDSIGPVDQDDRELVDLERQLLRSAELVLNDGARECRVLPAQGSGPVFVPGSMEIDHYYRAREQAADPADQAKIPSPRIGFLGVLNHTFDFELLEAVASLRPEWQFVLVGPVNIDISRALARRNVHYVGDRAFSDHPAYLSGWDAAILPLRRDSGLKRAAAIQVPQYLAAGLPVVSSPIPVLQNVYTGRDMVWFGETPEQFCQGLENALAQRRLGDRWLEKIDAGLPTYAWDQAWAWMKQAIAEALVSTLPARSIPFERKFQKTAARKQVTARSM